MTRNELAATRLGDRLVRNGKVVTVSDIDRSKERVMVEGHWISYRNLEVYRELSATSQEDGNGPAVHTMKHWEWKDGVLCLKVDHLVKYGFPTTAILHTIQECGEDGFTGSNKELHERLPFLPPEYIRNLVPKMVNAGMLLRTHLKHGVFHLTTTNNI